MNDLNVTSLAFVCVCVCAHKSLNAWPGANCRIVLEEFDG